MSERLVERYGEDPHLVRLMEVTEAEDSSLLTAFTDPGDPTYIARCQCGWTDTEKYYKPAREKGLAHGRTGVTA
jgi:hypothetical protein